MSIISEISIPILVGNSGASVTGTLGTWAASEQLVIIDTAISNGEISEYSCASSEKIVSCSIESGVNFYGWLGNANTVANFDLNSSIMNCCAKPMSWLGNANTTTIHSLIEDEHNKSLITSDNENSVQGNNNVDWNYFPFPTEEVVQITGNRDLSRYQKTYSFSRHQPVRIRMYR